MLFNSLDFAVFLPLVFLLYWFVFNKSLRQQNAFVLVVSYIFYGWWDWRFLSLIAFSTLVDYSVGRQLGRTDDERKRKWLLWTSLGINLGFLAFFKYYNFFLDNFKSAFTFFGAGFDGYTLNILLPVGISFYTFQTLSYTIDIYRRKLEPAQDLVAFSAFVSFFPQLVAGPIERASNLLPQFFRNRSFDYAKAVDGCRQILWGLFKKVVIADNCAEIANQTFNNPEAMTGSSLVLGAILFAIQIYGDFSGYSDIAIGTARLFGFQLMRNFAFPYFSRDVAEFWRRWHISLTTWFKDYVYIPLGGSRGGKWLTVRNTFVIFLVSGFWHGANWTFLFWGLLNALYFLPLLLSKRNRTHVGPIADGRVVPTLKEAGQIATTFLLTILAWVFFRSPTIADAFQYLRGIANPTLFSLPNVVTVKTLILFVFLLFFFTIEWLHRDREHALEFSGKTSPRYVRYACYISLAIAVLWFRGTTQEFIYFQF